jgi:hypothetical protein
MAERSVRLACRNVVRTGHVHLILSDVQNGGNSLRRRTTPWAFSSVFFHCVQSRPVFCLKILLYSGCLTPPTKTASWDGPGRRVLLLDCTRSGRLDSASFETSGTTQHHMPEDSSAVTAFGLAGGQTRICFVDTGCRYIWEGNIKMDLPGLSWGMWTVSVWLMLGSVGGGCCECSNEHSGP